MNTINYRDRLIKLLQEQKDSPDSRLYKQLYTIFLMLRENRDENRLYTLSETAEILKVSKRTLYRMLDAGTLHAEKMNGKYRITYDELERLRNGHEEA